MAEATSAAKSGKVVIRNIGLLLSGDIDKPILDADTIVVNDGLIVAVGKEKDCDTEGAKLAEAGVGLLGEVGLPATEVPVVASGAH